MSLRKKIKYPFVVKGKPMATHPTPKTDTASLLYKLPLVLALVLLSVFLFYLLAQTVGFINTGQQSRLYGMDQPSLEAILVYGGFLIFWILLSALPLILVYTYSTLQLREIQALSTLYMAMLGLLPNKDNAGQMHSALSIFDRRSHTKQYIIPSLFMLVLGFFMWGLVLFPRGATGILMGLSLGGEALVRASNQGYTILGIPEYFEFVVINSSPITWAFLGAYFYIITGFTYRWFQFDLTVGFLWRSNVRLVVVLLLGLLMMLAGNLGLQLGETWLEADLRYNENLHLRMRELGEQERLICLLAFFAGIVPNAALYWLGNKLKALGDFDLSAAWLNQLFSPPDIQKEIDGLGFWQADRLAEQGIESVSDLATADLLHLIINTRFEARQLINWVDQAILYQQRSTKLLPPSSLHEVGIWRASDLLDIWYWGSSYPADPGQILSPEMKQEMEARRSRLVKTLLALKPQLSQEECKAQELLIANTLENIVNGIEVGTNINYICTFWRNDTAAKRQELHPQVAAFLKEQAI
jgi:hypothetical protein